MPRRPRTTPVPSPGPAPQQPASIAIPLDEQAEEERRLRQTIEFIDGAVLRLRDRATTKSANLDLVVATTVNTHELLTQLEQARPSPYFGRVDFHPSVVTPQAGSREGSSGPRRYKRESHYIGKYHVPDHVSSWTAPVAALYYKPAATGYRAPEGYVSGRIELKREFEIRDSQIKAIADLVRLLPSGQTAAIAAIPASTSLEKALRGVADGEMYEAIQTIQPEQYEEIAAGEKLVMVLQGAAGSGKSLWDYIASPTSCRLSARSAASPAPGRTG